MVLATLWKTMPRASKRPKITASVLAATLPPPSAQVFTFKSLHYHCQHFLMFSLGGQVFSIINNHLTIQTSLDSTRPHLTWSVSSGVVSSWVVSPWVASSWSVLSCEIQTQSILLHFILTQMRARAFTLAAFYLRPAWYHPDSCHPYLCHPYPCLCDPCHQNTIHPESWSILPRWEHVHWRPCLQNKPTILVDWRPMCWWRSLHFWWQVILTMSFLLQVEVWQGDRAKTISYKFSSKSTLIVQLGLDGR